MLEEFGSSLYLTAGPTVSFYGFPYPTRMAVARLSDGSTWVWSPIALTEDLARAIEAIGPVRHIVSPNKLHYLFLGEWAARWPDAKLFAPPGLARKRPDLHFAAELQDEPDAAWADDVDQVIFHGSFAMEEVAFFHRESRTAIIGDLIQQHSPENMSGLKGKIMHLDGLVGAHGSTPREWRLTFLNRTPARTARQKVLDWKPEGLLIAHGECVKTGATAIIEEALSWM